MVDFEKRSPRGAERLELMALTNDDRGARPGVKKLHLVPNPSQEDVPPPSTAELESPPPTPEEVRRRVIEVLTDLQGQRMSAEEIKGNLITRLSALPGFLSFFSQIQINHELLADLVDGPAGEWVEIKTISAVLSEKETIVL